jgi:hypothetical protein
MNARYIIIFFQLCFLLHAAQAVVNETELEQRLSSLEFQVQGLEQKTTLLEQWQQTINNTINALAGQLDSVVQWLGFPGSYADLCERIGVCQVPIVACHTEADCGDDHFIGLPFCTGDFVYQEYLEWNCVNPGTPQSYCDQSSTIELKEECPDTCLDGVCVECLSEADCPTDHDCVGNECVPVSTGSCTFRTNAVGGDYRSGTWISIDADGPDGVLEGFDYSGSYGLLTSCPGTVLAITPEGYPVTQDSRGVFVCIPQDSKVLPRKYWGEMSSSAVTDSAPADPYTSNGQEVCGEAQTAGGVDDSDGTQGGSELQVTVEGQAYGSLYDGEAQNFTLNDITFQVSIEFFNSTHVIFWVEGIRSEPIEQGQEYYHPWGIQIRVDEVVYSETEPGLVRFYLGA